jgi:hypothetical protein
MEATSARGGGGTRGAQGAFLVTDARLTSSTELQRDSPLPIQHGGVQATLAVLVGGTNTPCCSCIYVSQAAVDAHHVRSPPKSLNLYGHTSKLNPITRFLRRWW